MVPTLSLKPVLLAASLFFGAFSLNSPRLGQSHFLTSTDQRGQNGKYSGASGHTSRPYTIIVPSYRTHLQLLEGLVSSFHEYCSDRALFSIYVIVSEFELDEFSEVPSLAPETDVQVISLKSLLPQPLDENELLDKLGHIAFQALKKLLALSELNYDKVFLMDSEGRFIRPASLHKAMDSAAYHVIYDGNPVGMNEVQAAAVSVANTFLQTDDYSQWSGMALFYQWVFQKKVVNHMFAKLGADRRQGILDLCVQNRFVFPEIIYYTFLKQHSDQYNVHFHDVRPLLADAYGKVGLADPVLSTHVLEHFSEFISHEMVPVVQAIYQELKIGFVWSNQQFSEVIRDVNVEVICREEHIFLLTSTNYQLLTPNVDEELKDVCAARQFPCSGTCSK